VSEKKQLTPDEEKKVLEQFDDWLKDGGPAALVMREPLVPVEGPDGVFFPATFAAAEDKTKFPGGYNIDPFADGSNVCLVDSVGSQANRIEPIFANPDYAGLVPQVNIKAGEKTISLLAAGHRAGDAIVRCSELKGDLQAAFKDVLKGNAETLAKIAPTSLVFGVWDSRDTQAKLPRLVSSTIRAFNVKRLTRSAQYIPATEYVKENVLDEPADKKAADAYAERGFVHVPASGSHGGVQLMAGEKTQGSIQRDATLSLAALRRLTVLESGGALATVRTPALRRYILGLALVALTAEQETYLRQGCNLVSADQGKSRAFEVVHSTGKREPCKLTHDHAKKYAEVAAKAFGVGKNRDVAFDRGLAEKDIKGESDKAKGEVASLDTTEKRLKLKIGKGKDREEIDVTTNDSTVFMKGKEESTFDKVVAVGAKLEVEVVNGIAVKVTGKK
jgi:CRISPR-associated protein Csb1